MVDPIAVKQAIKDGQLKVYWKESRPHIISVYLGDVIRERGSFVEEIGDTIKLCDIRILEPRTEYERGYEKGKEDEHRWWSEHCTNCPDVKDEQGGKE